MLCTRIGIMCTGALRCVGTQQRLKNRFGDGYKLNINIASAEDGVYAAASRFICESLCPGAREFSHVGTSVSYMLPREGLDVALLFQSMEEHKTVVGIREWGLTQTSLEEVRGLGASTADGWFHRRTCVPCVLGWSRCS